MHRCSFSMHLMIGCVFMMGITVIRLAEGQIAPLCAQQLSPCVDYINSTNPPNTCCNPIKEIDATHKACFCTLGLTPSILEGLGITITQALKLLHSCGVNFNITTSCKVFSSALPPSRVQPQAMPGDDNGGADRVKSAGFSFVLFLLCICALFN